MIQWQAVITGSKRSAIKLNSAITAQPKWSNSTVYQSELSVSTRSSLQLNLTEVLTMDMQSEEEEKEEAWERERRK